MSLRPWYNKDANYQTNAKSFMDYLARTNHFLEVLIEDYEIFKELVNEELKQIKFDSEMAVDDILNNWLEDGTLARIINDGVLGNKADITWVQDLVDQLNLSKADQLIVDDLINQLEQLSSKTNDLEDDLSTTNNHLQIVENDLNKVKQHAYVPRLTPPDFGSNGIDIANIKYATVINYWDSLVNDYPDFIIRTTLGLDESGQYPIYKYDFNNNETNDWVVIDSNIHGDDHDGDPKDASMVLYYLMRDIYDNWGDDGKLAELRWTLNFSIIPVANPWGFDNNSRDNANGIDLNRNFSWNFNNNGQGDTYFSEKETQYISNNLKDIQYQARAKDTQSKVLLYLPVHSFGHSSPPYFPYSASDISPMGKVFTSVSQYLTDIFGVNHWNGLSKASRASGDNYAERILGIPSGTAEFTVYRNDGLERTSQSVLQHMTFIGNLIYQSKRLNIRKRLKYSLLWNQDDLSIPTSQVPTVIKDMVDVATENPFDFYYSTGKTIITEGVEYVRIRANLFFEYDSETPEEISVMAGIYGDDSYLFNGMSIIEQEYTLGGSTQSSKTLVIQLETPPLHCVPNKTFEIKVSKMGGTQSLKLRGERRSWVSIEEVNRYGI